MNHKDLLYNLSELQIIAKSIKYYHFSLFITVPQSVTELQITQYQKTIHEKLETCEYTNDRSIARD